MFEHSVKVPRHYKVAANIFRKVSTEGGSVKSLLYDNKLRHFRTNVLYALITETIKHAADIDKIFENCNLIENESRLDPWLAKVLTAELLFGKKALPGQSKPEQTILSYKEKFEKYTSEHQDELKTEVIRRPRYVRINTNLLTTSDAIGAFQDEGYRFIRCTSGSYEDYLEQIQKLTEYDFTQDYHVKTMFVFSSGTKLHEHDLYLENKIILQDKATAMAVHLLAPPTGSVALDMCAAPGMKTTQLAAYMRNNGKIYAVERNEQRYETLCDFVKRTGSTCVETFHKDALEIKRGDHDDVEYILLDPSCSGSGMELCVHNYIEATRLAKLTSLQEKFLKHAMNAFPKAKRIVYSTCSLFPEENERVITNVVKTSRAKWRVQDVRELLKGQWKNFGSGMYGSMGTRCMYARTETDLTTGFFLAVLYRDQKDLEKSLIGEDNASVGQSKGNPNDGDQVNNVVKTKKNYNRDLIENVKEETDEAITEEVPKKKKKNKDKHLSENKDYEPSHSKDVDVNIVETTKSKKKNRIPVEEEELKNPNSLEDDKSTSNTEHVTKKKKKKNKHKENESSTQVNGGVETINETQDSSEVSKKKKKRKRDTENEIAVEETVPANNIIDIDAENIATKKKKKKDRSDKSI